MLSPKLSTEFLQDISASFDQDQGIPLDTLLMVYLLFADDLVFFSKSAEGLQKQLTALYSTNEMVLRIMTSRDITVVMSLAQSGCFKQFFCLKHCV